MLQLEEEHICDGGKPHPQNRDMTNNTLNTLLLQLRERERDRTSEWVDDWESCTWADWQLAGMLSGCWFTAGRTRGEDKHLCLIVFVSHAQAAKQACSVRCVGALLWWISVFCGAESSRHGEPGNPGGRSGHRSDYHITVLWLSCIIIHPQWGCMFVCVGSLLTAIDSLCLTIWYNYCLSFILLFPIFSFYSIYLVYVMSVLHLFVPLLCLWLCFAVSLTVVASISMQL